MRFSLQTRILATELFIECQNYNDFREKWREKFESDPPSRKAVKAMLEKFRSTGTLKDKQRPGRKKTRDDNLVATVGAFFHINQEASINTFLREFDFCVSRSTVWRILKIDLQWKPFRPRRVHKLLPGDDIRRYWCLDAFFKKLNDDPTFITKIIWSDECIFKLNGNIATNNVVHWARENPHFTFERSTNRSGVMVFAAISVIGLVALAFFDETDANRNKKNHNSVNKQSYTEILEKQLIPEISQMFPQQEVFFMQDGASAHRIPVVLNQLFSNRWLGNANHGAPLIWPSRSPDLTPMGKFYLWFASPFFSLLFQDFSFWGVLRQRVFKRSPHSIDQLKNYICEEARSLPLEYFMKTCNQQVLVRWIECKRSSGKTIENMYGIN